MGNKKKKIIVAVSGGWDPIHVGHVRLFQEARKLGDKLVVILNNDNWLRKKKGYVFMSEKERKEILETIRGVDQVILTSHPAEPADMSVCAELKKIRPHIFANGGDRTANDIPEAAVCNKLGCKIIFNIGRGGKIQSSSWLVSDRSKKINNGKKDF
ncbi:MAG: adenylyltransferase/cytidyltransferase family protein [Candidatus Yanofskybacteria bacterium]|nr:adenylyltransferase/cytidyltransferase family protein [Candidatus Yanofskybacteria bacterium]